MKQNKSKKQQFFLHGVGNRFFKSVINFLKNLILFARKVSMCSYRSDVFVNYHLTQIFRMSE